MRRVGKKVEYLSSGLESRLEERVGVIESVY